ncbi:hypothetical protein [Curtobacterium sp. Curtsp57]|uniref:hypothetical protein n=1 Tax=Curtobacterium sp. Curtsp57 TaxID=3243047 RepID=UPI0039B4265F
MTGCAAGIAYYGAMAILSGPVVLLLVQPLHAWFVGIIAGVGLTLFQDLIPRPGLASGMFTNIRKVGAIISGGVIAIAGIPGLGYGTVFAACGVIALLVLVIIAITLRPERSAAPTVRSPAR